MTSRPRLPPRRTLLWWAAASLAAGLALGVAVWAFGNGPLLIDAWWQDALGAPGGVPLAVAHFFNRIGGGYYAILWVPLAVTAVLLVLRRPWGAGAFLAASALSSLFVQLLKVVFSRARPEDILLTLDSASFPSGHAANAATLTVVLWLLFPRWWMGLVAVLWPVSMAWSRTYLSAHWLSDTIGGILVGAGIALLTVALVPPVRAETVRRLRGRPVPRPVEE